ncbi:MAG TPA: AsmA family protein, partial [Terriglobia bacterium]|nr:AsmA family protein [Terriglobia bacterium]
MRLFQRPRLRTTLLAFAALLLAAWLIPPFFHAGRYRRVLQSELENRLGRPVEFGAVHLRLLPHPGFSMENVVIEENPGFGWEPFARVASVECDLRWRSLWSSHVGCSRILLDHPTVDIARNAAGKWNIGTFLRRSGAASAPHPARKAPLPGGFVLEARDARINFTLGATQKPFVINRVQAQVQFDPASRLVRFDLTGAPQRIDLASPPPSQVRLSGVWNSQGIFRAALSTQGSLLYGWIPLLTGHDAGIYGIVDANLNLTGSVKRIAVRGHMHLDQLHRRESLPPSSSMPVDVSFSGLWDRNRQQLMVRRLDATFAGSHIHAAGALTGAPRQPQLNMVVAVQRSRLENLISLAARLTGHRASVRAAGRLDGLLTIQGPWKARRYAGLLSIRSMSVRTGDARFSFPEVSVRIDRQGAHLVPLRFHPAAGVTCLAQGILTPAFPDAKSPVRTWRRAARGSYALSITLSKAPLHGLIRLAAELHMARFRNFD